MASFANTDRSAGRSNSKTMTSNSYDPARTKLTLSVRSLRSTSSLHMNDEHTTEGTSPVSPQETRRSSSRTTLRRDTVLSQTSTTSLNKTPHAKLHKRASSGGSPSPYSSTFPTPFATYEEPSTDTSKGERSSSAPKLKAHHRRSSSAKGDQGRIDLSKSAAENDRLAELGTLQDFSAKPEAGVNSRKHLHGRNISNASQASTGSAGFRPGQPFTHPMAKTPRPYTPPTGATHASLLDNEEAKESEDVVEDEFRIGNGFRSRRSLSINSAGYANPSVLSQSYSASSVAIAPKHSISQSNLSIMSTHSDMSKAVLSDESPDPSPPSRTSIDKARSFVSRRSDTEPPSREELIRAARKKFEAKEASKTRKDEQRRERQRQKSLSESRPAVESKSTSSSGSSSSTKPETKSSASLHQSRRKSNAKAGASREDEKDKTNNEKLHARSYEDYRPVNAASLPIYGDLPGESEKRPTQHSTAAKKSGSADHNWLRFSTWVQTRMLSCGDRA